MTRPATFSHQKRNFLHHKLDDVLHLWAMGSGQGTFHLSVCDGIPNFQCGLHLDFQDVAGSVPDQAVQQITSMTPTRINSPGNAPGVQLGRLVTGSEQLGTKLLRQLQLYQLQLYLVGILSLDLVQLLELPPDQSFLYLYRKETFFLLH